MPGQEPGADRKLSRRQAKGFPRYRFRYTIEFKKEVPWANRRHPKLRVTLSFTHSGFRRAFGHGLVRKDLNPKFTFSFHVTSQRHPSRLDLCIRYPGAFQRLQGILAKCDRHVASRISSAATSLVFSVFNSLWY